MTTLTMKTYYCAVCEAVAVFGKETIRVFEMIGYAKAAAELARMGYHTEAKNLIIMKNSLAKKDA